MNKSRYIGTLGTRDALDELDRRLAEINQRLDSLDAAVAGLERTLEIHRERIEQLAASEGLFDAWRD